MPAARIFAWHDSHLPSDQLFRFFVDNQLLDDAAAGAARTSYCGQVFHLDLAREVQTGLDACLTQLFIFGGLVDSTGRVWRRDQRDLYLVEHSPNLFCRDEFHVLAMLPRIRCLGPVEALQRLQRIRDESGDAASYNSPWEPLYDTENFKQGWMRRPALALDCFDRGLNSPPPLASGVMDQPVEILAALLKHCGLTAPAWQELINFAKFFNKQMEDCDNSVFCSEVMKDDLPGFREFIVRCMLLMSKDFATRSLNISDESGGRDAQSSAPAAVASGSAEQLLQQYNLKRRWEHEVHPYVLFNHDRMSFTFFGFVIDRNGNLLDAKTRAVIQPGVMPPQLFRILRAQRVPLDENFDTIKRPDKIARLRTILGYQTTGMVPDPDPSYELTLDNVKKMLAIVMRFRCGIPVVVMGETGCGKTRLVEYLAKLMRPSTLRIDNMIVLKVHGGITEDSIVNVVRKAEKLADRNYKSINKANRSGQLYTVLFFDEVNTTSAVGLIKEIMCDGRVHGRPINFTSGLRCVAACNPYRQHSEAMIQRLENSGLGYWVRKDATQDRFGAIPMRHLVYRVKPLPLSLINVLWDFGNLSEDAEAKYIQRMIEARVHELVQPHCGHLAELVRFSQAFMRRINDETKFVSLREVEKVIQVVNWLIDFQQIIVKNIVNEPDDHLAVPAITDYTRAALLTAAICYYSRLSYENKQIYLTELAARLCDTAGRPLTDRDLYREIYRCQEAFLNSAKLPDFIAKNDALRENLFMMIVCIKLRIPLFVVGKPGSSKSLAKTIVKSNMLGADSQSNLFKELPGTHMLSFQCSPWSTSDSIIKTFSQCSRLQDEKDLSKFVSVIILDEIGLAEDSPSMPLKTLHPLLEDGFINGDGLTAEEKLRKKIGFIGISNWALDPAKMNRGLYVQRDVPTEDELVETAKGICGRDDSGPIVNYLEPLAKFYRAIYKETLKVREFFGLRDFFSLVKHLAAWSKASQTSQPSLVSSLSDELLTTALLRNFSGFDINPVKLYARLVGPDNSGTLHKLANRSVVAEALASRGELDQRYLLFITENYSGFRVVLRQITGPASVIFGSSFPRDQAYTKICKDINRIKICMERGETVVLMNMDSLYESLYDVLNQYYESCGEDRFVDLGLGTHRLKCKVHSHFRIVVIAERDTVMNKFPIPLINRMEKHRLSCESLLNSEDAQLCAQLLEWARSFLPTNSTSNQNKQKVTAKQLNTVFVGYHEDVVPSLLIEFANLANPERVRAVQHALLAACTPESLVRLDQTPLAGQKDALSRLYHNDDRHSGLEKFLSCRAYGDKQFVQVTTFDRLLSKAELSELSARFGPNLGLLQDNNLNDFDTEIQFTNYLNQFFKCPEPTWLILQFEALRPGYQNRVSCAKYLVEDFAKQPTAHAANKLVILVVKLIRSHTNPFTGFECGHWCSAHLEELVASSKIAVGCLGRRRVHELFATGQPMEVDSEPSGSAQPEAIDIRLLLLQSLHAALAMLAEGGGGGGVLDARSTKRYSILANALNDQEFLAALNEYIVSTLEHRESNSYANYNPNDWLSFEAAKDENVTEAGTFMESAWRNVKRKVIPALACFVAFVDKEDNLDGYSLHRRLWLRCLRPAANRDQLTASYHQGTGELQRIDVPSSSLDGHRFVGAFPFAWCFAEQLRSLAQALPTAVQSASAEEAMALDLARLLSRLPAAGR
ncbi:hypothetical protein BOX15_Mlig015539g1 [Macrostomum lignano]|uniref:AAA+ ATPase domain-containing protein n=1 Tax=Macrostomum lignano TaxID=282301 RepID=A0A267EWC5_9PLAT|nr:hypothetical protein BOX15_Mlig015539g1 [Macrostomum lignano]